MTPEEGNDQPHEGKPTFDYASLESAQPDQASEVQIDPPSPEAPTTKPSPIIVAGGMGYTKERNDAVAAYLAGEGRPVVPALSNVDLENAPSKYRVVDNEGIHIKRRAFAYLDTDDPDTILISSLQQEARADELIEHLERQDKGPVTQIAQSADAQNAIIAAYQRPDLFNNLVLLFPSGMVKKQKKTEYLRQIARSFRRRGEKVPKPVIGPETHFEGSPLPDSWRERARVFRDKRRAHRESGGYTVAASAIAAYNNQLLSSMRHGEDPPGVAMVLGAHDPMMRPDRILESIVSARDVDIVLVDEAGHGLAGDKALAKEVMKLVDRLDALKADRQAAHDRGETIELGPLKERLLFTSNVPEAEQNRLLEIAENVPLEPGATHTFTFERPQ